MSLIRRIQGTTPARTYDDPSHDLVSAERNARHHLALHDLEAEVTTVKARREVRAKTDVTTYALGRLMDAYDDALEVADGSAMKQRMVARGITKVETSVWDTFDRHFG